MFQRAVLRQPLSMQTYLLVLMLQKSKQLRISQSLPSSEASLMMTVKQFVQFCEKMELRLYYSLNLALLLQLGTMMHIGNYKEKAERVWISSMRKYSRFYSQCWTASSFRSIFKVNLLIPKLYNFAFFYIKLILSQLNLTLSLRICSVLQSTSSILNKLISTLFHLHFWQATSTNKLYPLGWLPCLKLVFCMQKCIVMRHSSRAYLQISPSPATSHFLLWPRSGQPSIFLFLVKAESTQLPVPIFSPHLLPISASYQETKHLQLSQQERAAASASLPLADIFSMPGAFCWRQLAQLALGGRCICFIKYLVHQSRRSSFYHQQPPLVILTYFYQAKQVKGIITLKEIGNLGNLLR